MAYAGKVSDMRPEDRYDSSRIRPLIDQAIKEPWLREVFNALLYRIERLEKQLEENKSE